MQHFQSRELEATLDGTLNYIREKHLKREGKKEEKTYAAPDREYLQGKRQLADDSYQKLAELE